MTIIRRFRSRKRRVCSLSVGNTLPAPPTIRSEAIVVEELQLDYPNNIQLVRNYQQDIHLTETNMLIRRHHTLHVFGDELAECIKMSRRDQLSFDLLVEHTQCYRC